MKTARVRLVVSDLCAVLMVVLCFHLAPVYAYDAVATQSALSSAITYLESNQNSTDGSWGDNDDLRYVTTASVVEALSASNRYSRAYYNGVAWLENRATNNVDEAARKIIALSQRDYDADYELALLAEARRTGANGLGLNSIYTEDTVDSALALRAAVAMGDVGNQTLLKTYLLSVQLPGGGWSLGQDTTISYWATAEVLIALNTLTPDPTVSGAIGRAVTALAGITIADDSIILARAALAVYQGNNAALTINVDNWVTQLLARQSSGSWGDPFTTALVSRTLAAVTGVDASDYTSKISIPDQNLRAALNRHLGNNAFDSINQGQLLTITDLDLHELEITDLTGLEQATNLEHLLINEQTAESGYIGIRGAVIEVDNNADGIADYTLDVPDVVLSVVGSTTREAGDEVVVLSLALDTSPRPEESLVFNFSLSNVHEFAFVGGVNSLMFNESNWSIPQTITVKGLDDCTYDGNISGSLIIHPVAYSDASYTGPSDYLGYNLNDIAIQNLDDESESIPNNCLNLDSDGDGVSDSVDRFPADPNESGDLDNDGIGDNADLDRDGDGVVNTSDAFPNDASESSDLDNDGIGDNSDTDRDGDGVNNASDAFPDDATETIDSDGDGVGDNTDAFPLDPNLTSDNDHDGIDDSTDPDDDNDDLTDVWEIAHGFNPMVTNAEGLDSDGDGLTDLEEQTYGSDPHSEDGDGDLMPDAWEVKYAGLDPLSDDAQADLDGDLYTNLWEYDHHNDPSINEFDDQAVSLIASYSHGNVGSNGLTLNLNGAQRVVVHPNGRFVAVTTSAGLSIFRRDSETGELAFLSYRAENYFTTWQHHAPVFSQDGQSLYVLNTMDTFLSGSDVHQLKHYRFNEGVLTPQPTLSFKRSSAEGMPWMGSGQGGNRQIVISPDDKHIYLATSYAGVIVFERDLASGALTFRQQFLNGGTSLNVRLGLSVSTDGLTVYAQDQSTLLVLNRDATTGELSLRSSRPVVNANSLYGGWGNDAAIQFVATGIQALDSNGAVVHQQAVNNTLGGAVNRSRSLVYSHQAFYGWGTTYAFNTYALGDAGFTALAGPLASENPWLTELSELAASPDGKHLYSVSVSQNRLVAMTAGYKGLGRPDRDGDGVEDILDVFPDDAAVSVDTDGDGLPDQYNANCNSACQATSSAVIDEDDDEDGVLDTEDAFALNAAASADFDGDGQPDVFNGSCNADCQASSGLSEDLDDDNDGYLDSEDALPFNSTEWANADGDTIGDNADPDDDNDEMPDAWEIAHGLNPLDDSDALLDPDGDTLTNLAEYQRDSDPALADTDGDGVVDQDDQMPRDAAEAFDNDGDGIGDNADPDDDNDDLTDAWELAHGFDPLVANPVGEDSDNDGLTDLQEQHYGSDPHSEDGDGDRMPDVWEVQYAGLDPLSDDAQADLDGDLYTNLWEYDHHNDPSINEFDDQAVSLIASYSHGNVGSNGLSINLSGAQRVVVHPNGRYVVATTSAGLSIFRRDPETGTLVFLSYRAENYSTTWQHHAPVFSQDGQSLYVLNTMDTFTSGSDVHQLKHYRFNEGVLTPQPTLSFKRSSAEGMPWMGSGQGGNRQIVLSPDDKHVYLTASYAGVIVFERDLVSGALTFRQQFLNGGTSLNVRLGLSVSTDGLTVYAQDQSTLLVLNRDATTGDLSLRSSRPVVNANSLYGGWGNDAAIQFVATGIQALDSNGAVVHQQAVNNTLGGAVNRSRGLVYSHQAFYGWGTTYAFNTYALGEAGFTALAGPLASENPWLTELSELAASPDGKHLYSVSVSQNRLVAMTAGYKGLGHPDTDSDGVRDLDDAFPLDPTEWTDTDGDGFGDNFADAFPANPAASVDTDNDGRPNQFHTNCDANCQAESGLVEDLDDDGDGVDDVDDAYPLNRAASLDTDGDGDPDEFSISCDAVCQSGSGLTEDLDDDNDDLPDTWENQYGLPSKDASNRDQSSDADLLTDYEEFELGTQPNNVDSDGDEMPDDWEVVYHFNPLDPTDAGSDFDGDGFTNLQEFVEGTYPDDPTHYPGAPGLKEWEGQTNNAVRTKPVIGYNGLTYAGSDDGFLYAFDGEGNEVNSFETEGPIRSSPALGADGTIYVGTFDGKLYALTPELIEIWSVPFQTGGNIESSPAVGLTGEVFVGSDDGRLYALNPDGSEKWSYQTGGPIKSSPRIGPDGMIYVGSDDGKVYAINSDTGGPLLP